MWRGPDLCEWLIPNWFNLERMERRESFLQAELNEGHRKHIWNLCSAGQTNLSRWVHSALSSEVFKIKPSNTQSKITFSLRNKNQKYTWQEWQLRETFNQEQINIMFLGFAVIRVNRSRWGFKETRLQSSHTQKDILQEIEECCTISSLSTQCFLCFSATSSMPLILAN